MPKAADSLSNAPVLGPDKAVIKNGAMPAAEVFSDVLADALFDAEQSRFHIVSMQRQISSLKRELLAANQLLQARRMNSLKLDDPKISTKSGVIIDLEQQLLEARQEVSALRASTSWRITAPLRRLKGG